MSLRRCCLLVDRSEFAGFRFPPDVIAVTVRWYLRYGLSYRDVEELLAERGIVVDHVTVYGWVHRFTLLFIDAARPCRHSPGQRWFVDETYLKTEHSPGPCPIRGRPVSPAARSPRRSRPRTCRVQEPTVGLTWLNHSTGRPRTRFRNNWANSTAVLTSRLTSQTPEYTGHHS